MKKRIEYRLWYKEPSETVWERWSGGVKPNRDEWIRVANADNQRRRQANLPELQYSITKRYIIDYEREML